LGNTLQGRIQDFKLGGAQLKKLRRAEGGPKIFGVFRVKNHDFTPKHHIFPILGGAREIFGVFHVKNHDFMPKKIIFFPILGGGAPGASPPPALINLNETKMCAVCTHENVNSVK
jgi:hypothetical protein